ncbi:MAG TPA: hypothetical protein ENJ42_06375 [Hellea balneolensis]|uniref:DUF1579 domain-containing protein n=1 Tax=Hellea balneolensis TaxID=287478 RepID=A0A7C5QWI1_9PROT|nr:hypothetical protein [Hellea balneolensis]
MNIKYSIPVLSLGLVMACAPSPDNKKDVEAPLGAVLMDKDDGCHLDAMQQFGRYLGDWQIQDWQLQKDGSWMEQKGARWVFKCVGNGIAVQDFWMPNTGGSGTNLRMYDPKAKVWKIVWTASGSKGETRITAKQNAAGDMVMNTEPVPGRPWQRITFFTPTEKGWNWVMEFSSDQGENWKKVYKIKATKNVGAHNQP